MKREKLEAQMINEMKAKEAVEEEVKLKQKMKSLSDVYADDWKKSWRIRNALENKNLAQVIEISDIHGRDL